MTTASLNGNDVYYELSGSGPKLLFLNGTGATLANTAPLVTFLSGDFEVAAFDQRGLGRSLLPDDGYTMADLAAIAAVLNGVSVWTSATFSTYHGVAWSVPGWGSFFGFMGVVLAVSISMLRLDAQARVEARAL